MTYFLAVEVIDPCASLPNVFRGVAVELRPKLCFDCKLLKALLRTLDGAAFSSLRILNGVEADSILATQQRGPEKL